MISIYPTIYHEFQCKAERCENTCCQKWTIDVDKKTAKLYQTLPTQLGEDLRQFMTVDDEGYYFMFTDTQPTCPLLREDGLCRIILEMGEDSLCDTCQMHPRFYKYIEDLELCGVGLSCEESVEKLAATTGDTVQFTVEDDDYQFTAHDRLTIQNIFELLAFELDESLVHYNPIINENHYKKLLALYSTTEPIDAAWTSQVNQLSQQLPHLVKAVTDYVTTENHSLALYNKVYQYILYRQIDMLADYSLPSIIRYAQEGTDYILISAIMEGNALKQIARWSQQIEYDEDNVLLLLEEYENEIKQIVHT